MSLRTIANTTDPQALRSPCELVEPAVPIRFIEDLSVAVHDALLFWLKAHGALEHVLHLLGDYSSLTLLQQQAAKHQGRVEKDFGDLGVILNAMNEIHQIDNTAYFEFHIMRDDEAAYEAADD